MADYTVYWASVKTPTEFLGELPLTSFTYTDTLNSPGSITGTFPLDPYPELDDTAAAAILTPETFAEGRTVLWVDRDGVPMWSGLLWSWEASVDQDAVTFTGEGWLSYFRRRRLNESVTYEGAAVDQIDLASGLVSYPQIAPGGLVWVIAGNPNSGVTRERTYYWWEAKTFGEMIEELAAVENGFDFRFRPRIEEGDRYTWFETIYPATGPATDHVFELGTNCSVTRFTSDGKSLANSFRAFGSGQGAEVTIADAFDSAALDTYPLLEEHGSYPDVIRPTTLAEHATQRLQRLTVPTRLLELDVWPDTEPGLGDYLVGDRVKVTANRGFLQLNKADYRITSRTVTVDESGGETVSVSLAPAAMFG